MRAWERQKVVRKDASTGDERLKCDSGVCGELGTKGNKMFFRNGCASNVGEGRGRGCKRKLRFYGEIGVGGEVVPSHESIISGEICSHLKLTLKNCLFHK